MKKLLSTILPLLVLVFVVGCGDPKVTGKVTFTDGTPLAKGQVMFQKEGFVGSGTIQKDGTYSAGKEKDGDGLPPGQYEVFITETSSFGELQGGPGVETATGTVSFEVASTVNYINPKYASPSTSELTVEVKDKAVVFDIVVEPAQ